PIPRGDERIVGRPVPPVHERVLSLGGQSLMKLVVAERREGSRELLARLSANPGQVRHGRWCRRVDVQPHNLPLRRHAAKLIEEPQAPVWQGDWSALHHALLTRAEGPNTRCTVAGPGLVSPQPYEPIRRRQPDGSVSCQRPVAANDV